MVVIGNITFSDSAEMSKEDFIANYKGKINIDIDLAWKQFKKLCSEKKVANVKNTKKKK